MITANGAPFIMIAGEVHNSNSSSVAYMEGVWEKAEALGMNSLLLPVTWEMLEPEEGVFDFALVDGLIAQARQRGKRLGLLWFGAWKNAQCYYAPAWVKTDLHRFQRAQVEKGKNHVNMQSFYGLPYTSLSYLCEETNRADAAAFAALMRHLRAVDAEENTVILVQVENEPGLQGAAREHSDEADACFEAEVPAAFAAHMRANTGTMAVDVAEAIAGGVETGDWQAIFGDVAEEVFSAYHIASYIEKVAAAGKEEYSLPMAVNCWLDKGQEPGIYPSGGPVARMMEVWKYCAPSIDVIAPDIYVPDFCGVCDQYVKLGNPLFVPETATHSYAGPRLVYAIGHYHAQCFAPFGFEEMGEPFSAVQGYLFGMDTEDPALKTPQDRVEYAWYARTLHDLMPLLTEKYGTTDLQAVICERKEADTMIMGRFGFKIMMEPPMVFRKDGVCLALKVSEDEFFLLANGCAITPFSTNPEKPHVDTLRFEEGCFEAGEWKMIRRLNGDEAARKCFEKQMLLKIKLFAYN